jgi:hypothetical protein
MKKRLMAVAALAAIALSNNVLATPQAGDSTTINIGGYRQAMQQQGSTGAYNGQSRAVSIPNQTIYVYQPTQTTYVTQNGTVQCSSYQTVHAGWRYATSQESMAWGGCSVFGTKPTMPNGTLINTSSSAPTGTNAQCFPQYYLVPVYTTVCGG